MTRCQTPPFEERPRIVLIDDDAATRTLLVEALGGVYDVRGFERASEAKTALETSSVRLVLLDVRVPDADGFALLEELRARWPATPVVVLSGSVGVESVVQAMRAGAADYVGKPIDVVQLTKAIARALPVPAAPPAPTFVLPANGVDLAALERSLVRQALERTGGNRTRAGRLLGINRDQVRYRLAKLEPPAAAPSQPEEEA